MTAAGRPRKDPTEVKQNRLAYRRQWGQDNRKHVNAYRREYDRTHPRYFPKPKPPSNSAFSRLDLQTGLGLSIGQFLNAKATKSDRTIGGYQGVLAQFAEHTGNRWPFDADDINSFLARKKAAGCNLTTVYGYYRALKVFCAWLVKRKKIQENPMEMAEKAPRPQLLPRVPPKEDVKAVYGLLQAQAQTGEWLGVRNMAMFSLMIDAGLRVGEVAKLKVNDLDLSRRVVTMRDTKTHADGTSYFGLGAAENLQAWKEVRATLPIPDELRDALFVTLVSRKRWRRMTVSCVQSVLRVACQSTGADHMTPHQLRHGCAVYSLQNGANLIDIQRQLRHKTPQMTLRYLMMNDEGREVRHLGYSPFDKTLGGAL